MRSKLFVPASRPDLIKKALRTAADAICIDLEDAVPLDGKAAARLALREFFQEGLPTDKCVLVRVNQFGCSDFPLDLEALAGQPVFAIALPKVESDTEVMQAVDALGAAGVSRSSELRLLPTVESARGLRLAAAIAKASPQVIGLQLGFADLFESLLVSPDNLFARQHVRLQLRLAAAEGGVPCYDSAYSHISDAAGYRAQLTDARSYGFAGASCIHPSQVALANEIFSPTEAEIRMARRVVEAAEAAATKGVGVFALDGKMIDKPFLERARITLKESEPLP